MRKVMSLRVTDEQVARLDRASRRLNRTRSEAAAVLLEEALRREEFALIEFHSTVAGREAFLHGTHIKVWQVAWLGRHFDGDPAKIAAHLELPVVLVQASLAYAKAYSEEIAAALADQEKGVEELERLIPNLQVFTADAPAS